MSGRPGQWHLLGEDSDPLPGDSYDVTVEARHYSDTATSIRDQVARLRKIAAGGNQLVGKYAPAMKDSAGDLADHLDQSQGRFDTVATELSTWAPTLERGRTDSMRYLRAAESAQGTLDANQPPTTPVDEDDPDAVAKEKTRSSHHATATTDLSNARSNYHDLMHNDTDGVRTIASRVAKRIDDASHDKLKDSWWDSHVRKWIHDHAALLKFIADVLTWIATAIVIAAVVIGTGGLGLAMLLTLGALVLHSVLAMNGDGSWVDVALDAFALVTMGAGKIATSGAKVALAGREGLAGFSATKAAARAAFSDASGLFGKAGAFFKESNLLARNVRGLIGGKSAFSATMKAFTESKLGFRGTMKLLGDPGRWNITKVLSGELSPSLFAFGDKTATELNAAIDRAIGEYGPGMLLDGAHNLVNITSAAFVSGTLVDAGFKFQNTAFPDIFSGNLADPDPLKGSFGPFPDWADEHTVPHGGYW